MSKSNLTNHIKELILKNNNDSRLEKQFILDENNERNDTINSLDDVAGDHGINRIKGLYHRYPSKVLIFPTQKCVSCCRFCFRKNIKTEEEITESDFEKIVEYISGDNKITEVIFSGGDPFAMEQQKLLNMIDRIKQIEHVVITRIHTRVLTCEPNLVNEKFVEKIKIGIPTYMVLHVNSHLEITDAFKEKVKLLTDNGIMCFSQTALLKDVNDNYDDLSSLFIELIKIKVKPYYLFHPDRVKGTGHFYISLKRGKQLYNSLFNRISGLAMPIYLFNVPGGYGHCIIGSDNVVKHENEYIIKTWDNQEVSYQEP